MSRSNPDALRAAGVRLLAPAELVACRGGDDLLLRLIMEVAPPWDSGLDPMTGTGPTCPPPPPLS